MQNVKNNKSKDLLLKLFKQKKKQFNMKQVIKIKIIYFILILINYCVNYIIRYFLHEYLISNQIFFIIIPLLLYSYTFKIKGCQLVQIDQIAQIMNSKEPITITTNKLLNLKLLFLSYFNMKEQSNLLYDCSNAIDKQTLQLNSKVKSHLDQIMSISQQQEQQQKKGKKNKKQMDVIFEQLTQRSNDQNYKKQFFDQKYFMQKFNSSISVMKNSEEMIDQIVYLYKTELKDLATQLTQSKRTINVLSDELKQLRQENSKLIKGGNTYQIINQKLIGRKKSSSSNIQNDQESQLFARQPPKPYDHAKNKQNNNEISNKIIVNENYIEKNKWQELSLKISQLKHKLSSYQSQLVDKQQQIQKLNEQLKKLKSNSQAVDSQQKKKMKSVNTTLRGQKIMLENQIHSLKKKVKQQEEITNIYEVQNKKLKLQIQNLQSTIKWHLNTINDLRNNFSHGLKEDAELLNKLKQSQESNKKLMQTIQNQELYLKQYNKKLGQIEISCNKKIQNQKQKITELQHMIDLKNETIIKIKASNKIKMIQAQNSLLIAEEGQGFEELKRTTPLNKTHKINYQISDNVKNSTLGQQKDSNYYTQMIRILTKKLQEKQQIIRNLSIVIAEMREGHIYNTFNTQMD